MLGPTGESTDVASAKRAALGVLIESPKDELDDVRDRTVILGTFTSFSSLGGVRCRCVSGSTGDKGS